MQTCERCQSETTRLPRPERTVRQWIDSFMFGVIGEALYFGQRRKLRCVACGHTQREQDGYVVRLVKRVLLSLTIIGAFAGIGAVLAAEESGVRMPRIVIELAERVGAHAAVAAFACAGAIVAILWLCLDAARQRR